MAKIDMERLALGDYVNYDHQRFRVIGVPKRPGGKYTLRLNLGSFKRQFTQIDIHKTLEEICEHGVGGAADSAAFKISQVVSPTAITKWSHTTKRSIGIRFKKF